MHLLMSNNLTIQEEFFFLGKELEQFADLLTNLISKYADKLEIDEIPTPHEEDDVFENNIKTDCDNLVSKIEL